MLVQRATDIDWAALEDVQVLGVTAGASAPDILIQEVLQGARDRFDVTIEEVTLTREDVVFKLPRVLTTTATAAE
jgi:4-hydroxy-3-methylbut-2-enyl diphosphate reductase